MRPEGPGTIAEREADIQRVFDSTEDPEWPAAAQLAFNATLRATAASLRDSAGDVRGESSGSA